MVPPSTDRESDPDPSLNHPPSSSHDTVSLPPITNFPPANSYSSSAAEMTSSMHYPPSGPSIGQPYSHNPSAPEHSPQSSTSSSNQYPQYSYDIQLRYPNSNPNSSDARPYEQPPYSVPPRIALPPISTMPMVGDGYGAPQGQGHFSDSTGQVSPPGAKPRVTATLWEDEGTLCFQVDVNGTCVARREDNHMINGTKLLNVVGMTRGRRDGILKSEKVKHVVKIGPMHLKGVWIPFPRALEFANKEKITEALYPLFVHNIGALLYHPSSAALSAAAGGMVVPRSEMPGPQSQSQPQQHEQTAGYYGQGGQGDNGGEQRSIYP